MTDNNRLEMIDKALKLFLEGKMGNTLEDLQPSAKEFLKLAFREDSPLGPYGMCGFPCDGACQTCETYTKSLAEYFATVVLREEEMKADEEWELEQRRNKEIDEINLAAAKELDDTCAYCGSECISYEEHGEVTWLCEDCYYNNQAQEIGYCGFPCGFGCPSCDSGGYDGRGEI